MPNANYAVTITPNGGKCGTDWRPCYVITKLAPSFSVTPRDCRNLATAISRATDPFEWTVIANK